MRQHYVILGVIVFLLVGVVSPSQAQSLLDGVSGLFGGGTGTKQTNTGEGGGLGGMFGNILSAKQNTDLGPIGRYVLGRKLSAAVVGGNRTVPPSDPRVSYVRDISQTLMMESRYFGNYKHLVVVLLDEPEVINAFAAPGGFVFVTTGMLEFCRDEDELALVLAHEISHIELDHGLNAIKAKMGLKMMGNIMSFSDEFTSTLDNGYSRDLEGEADYRGAQIATSAGYDPSAGVDVIRRLEKLTSRKHGTGYPADRYKNIMAGAGETPVDTDARKNRALRYQSHLQK